MQNKLLCSAQGPCWTALSTTFHCISWVFLVLSHMLKSTISFSEVAYVEGTVLSKPLPQSFFHFEQAKPRHCQCCFQLCLEIVILSGVWKF